MAETPQRGEFAEWLRAFRAHTQQTQKALAETMGVHITTIKRWESGTRYPDWSIRHYFNQWARRIGYRAVPPKHYGGR